MGKSDANECNESSLSNCRVQLAFSTKRDGVIFEKTLSIVSRIRETSSLLWATIQTWQLECSLKNDSTTEAS